MTDHGAITDVGGIKVGQHHRLDADAALGSIKALDEAEMDGYLGNVGLM